MNLRGKCDLCGKTVDARMTPKTNKVVLHRHVCARGYQSRGSATAAWPKTKAGGKS